MNRPPYVPAHLAGTTVTVREHATDFTIWQRVYYIATAVSLSEKAKPLCARTLR